MSDLSKYKISRPENLNLLRKNHEMKNLQSDTASQEINSKIENFSAENDKQKIQNSDKNRMEQGGNVQKKRDVIYNKSITVMLSEAEFDAIERIKAETGAGRSIIVRRALKAAGIV
jgi:hypothetical protein